ncbi:hypothetical protein GGR53DRAFT_479096 [Hypoxylon sp. FL1150]|nr:hypothetical protein GGR53DRAFT_479096 [Hypoxylon sp. FL1150]
MLFYDSLTLIPRRAAREAILLRSKDLYSIAGSRRSIFLSHSARTVRGVIRLVRRGPEGVASCSGAASEGKPTYPYGRLAMSNIHTASTPTKDMKKLAELRPSASVVLLSPENQVLLLHRVKTSSAFPSAHVFPGGNLSPFHDGNVPGSGDVEQHEDSLPYRLAAIRETFEESGILLAREDGNEGKPLDVPVAERDNARKAIYENKVRFVEWLASVGGVPDTENLIPFTRWITPPTQNRRFTTQMYLYMLPLSAGGDPAVAAARSEAMVPTPDGGVEITAARFDDATTWLENQRKSEITLFPPQCYLLHLLSQFLEGLPSGSLGSPELVAHHGAKRERLREFLSTVPTASGERAAKHPTSQIPWGEKVISPTSLGLRKSDKKVILGLDKPGPELKGTDKGGDMERVVLVHFAKGIAKDVEVRRREEVLAEERQTERAAQGMKL